MSASAFSSWATPAAADSIGTSSARALKKARGINGNGMGTPLAIAAAQWPTPNATDGTKEFATFPRGEDNPSLGLAARQWPTPRTPSGGPESAERKQELGRTESGGGDLQAAVLNWQTPGTDSFRSRGLDRKDEMGLDQQARTWGTPTVGTTGGLGQEDPSRGSRLQDQISVWPTPTANEDSFRLQGDSQQSKGLEATSRQWPTPMAMDPVKPSRGNRRSGDLSHRAQEHSTTGARSSSERRRLNPLFVEWLMAWPPGWTDSGLPVTGLSHWWQLQRFWLWRLGLVSDDE